MKLYGQLIFLCYLGAAKAGVSNDCRAAAIIKSAAKEEGGFPQYNELTKVLAAVGQCKMVEAAESKGVCKITPAFAKCCENSFNNELVNFFKERECLLALVLRATPLNLLLDPKDGAYSRASDRITNFTDDVSSQLQDVYDDVVELLSDIAEAATTVTAIAADPEFGSALQEVRYFVSDIMCSACDPENSSTATAGESAVIEIDEKARKVLKEKILPGFTKYLEAVAEFMASVVQPGTGFLDRALDIQARHALLFVQAVAASAMSQSENAIGRLLKELRLISHANDYLRDEYDSSRDDDPQTAEQSSNRRLADEEAPLVGTETVAPPAPTVPIKAYRDTVAASIVRCGPAVDDNGDIQDMNSLLDYAVTDLSMRKLVVEFGLGPQLCMYDVLINLLFLAPDPHGDAFLSGMEIGKDGSLHQGKGEDEHSVTGIANALLHKLDDELSAYKLEQVEKDELLLVPYKGSKTPANHWLDRRHVLAASFDNAAQIYDNPVTSSAVRKEKRRKSVRSVVPSGAAPTGRKHAVHQTKLEADEGLGDMAAARSPSVVVAAQSYIQGDKKPMGVAPVFSEGAPNPTGASEHTILSQDLVDSRGGGAVRFGVNVTMAVALFYINFFLQQ